MRMVSRPVYLPAHDAMLFGCAEYVRIKAVAMAESKMP